MHINKTVDHNSKQNFYVKLNTESHLHILLEMGRFATSMRQTHPPKLGREWTIPSSEDFLYVVLMSLPFSTVRQTYSYSGTNINILAKEDYIAAISFHFCGFCDRQDEKSVVLTLIRQITLSVTAISLPSFVFVVECGKSGIEEEYNYHFTGRYWLSV
jgi:hypothetical protein